MSVRVSTVVIHGGFYKTHNINQFSLSVVVSKLQIQTTFTLESMKSAPFYITFIKTGFSGQKSKTSAVCKKYKQITDLSYLELDEPAKM